MKKFIYSTLVLFAGLSAASCQQEELAIYDPGKVKAPTLGAVSGSTLKADGADIVMLSAGLCACGAGLMALCARRHKRQAARPVQ